MYYIRFVSLAPREQKDVIHRNSMTARIQICRIVPGTGSLKGRFFVYADLGNKSPLTIWEMTQQTWSFLALSITQMNIETRLSRMLTISTYVMLNTWKNYLTVLVEKLKNKREEFES